jgi:hypothetical protein
MKKNKLYFPKLCPSGSGPRIAGSALPGARRWLRLLCIMCLGVLTFAAPVNAQTVTVSGLVTDEPGESLPGVYVVINGSPTDGTVTGTDGRYTLKNVPAGAVLSFSFIGFKTQEVPVNGRIQIDIQL